MNTRQFIILLCFVLLGALSVALVIERHHERERQQQRAARAKAAEAAQVAEAVQKMKDQFAAMDAELERKQREILRQSRENRLRIYVQGGWSVEEAQKKILADDARRDAWQR